MSVCPICLGPGAPHAECIRALYDADRPPAVDVELARLHTVALAMVGRISVSGVQRKLSVGLSADRSTLRISTDGRQFILKPQSETFPYLPQNEHVTMRMAALAGVEVPPCGLIELADGSVAYIVRRFDRPDPRPEGPHKLRMEDFCQLAEKPPKDKYAGSAELCARLVRRYADEPGVELVRLLRLLAFNWWVGNGDAHLKNFALLAGLDGRHRLSPAYDLLCTRLVIPDDPLALPVQGRDRGLTAGVWRRLAAYAGVPEAPARRVLRGVADALEPALALIDRADLPDAMRDTYRGLLRQRAEVLAAV